MNINKSYIKQVFKDNSIQLTQDALALIITGLRKHVTMMAIRCKRYNIKRLTSDPAIYGIVEGTIKTIKEINYDKKSTERT